MLGASNHSEKEREINDYYATDPMALEIFLKALERDGFKLHNRIWECACGQGHLSKVLKNKGFAYGFKWSENVIDLIEVGDYVNGYKIFRIDVIDGEKVFKMNECSFTEFLRTWKNKDIKSIVTHESFNSIKYEVI